MKELLFLLPEDRGDLSERTETGTELPLYLNLEKNQDFQKVALNLEVCFCSQLHSYSSRLLHWERAVWKNFKPSLQFYLEDPHLGRGSCIQFVTHC